MTVDCELVLPCRNEGIALPRVLAAVPRGISVIVVDNGSSDDTADIARRQGARVVHERWPGYGAAVDAGVRSAIAEYVAVMDADGSMDPATLTPMVADVRCGDVTLAVGRRRPVSTGVWPWHARAGNSAAVCWLRLRTGLKVHDIAPVRVCRREDLLGLDVQDRRFGYPVELLIRAAAAGWSIREYDVAYRPRAAGTRSKVSGSAIGTLRAARDFARALS